MRKRSVLKVACAQRTVRPSGDTAGPRRRLARRRASRLVALLKAGKTPEEMRVAYPSLTLAQIHAAICYYYECPDEIEVTLAEDDSAEAEHEHHKAEYLVRRAGE